MGDIELPENYFNQVLEFSIGLRRADGSDWNGSRYVVKSAAYGQNGSLRGRSDSFPEATDDQIRAIVEGFNDVNVLTANGLYLGNEKFMVIQGVPGVIIRGRNKQDENRKVGGCCIHKTSANNILIATFEEPVLAADVNMLLAEVAKKINESGF
ncbi:unnamed protein product [Closterium sp. NIES-53]